MKCSGQRHRGTLGPDVPERGQGSQCAYECEDEEQVGTHHAPGAIPVSSVVMIVSVPQ